MAALRLRGLHLGKNGMATGMAMEMQQMLTVRMSYLLVVGATISCLHSSTEARPDFTRCARSFLGSNTFLCCRIFSKGKRDHDMIAVRRVQLY